MSHAKERKEKICLNCNAELNGRFCHICGQENIEPKESLWGLISHFFYDITHFDGKFFKTTGILFSRPGLLPKEYIAGKRASYLHPIRMYVFTSAFFFLIFFSLFSLKKGHAGADKDIEVSDSAKAALHAGRDAAVRGLSSEDSADVANIFDKIFSKTVSEKPEKDSNRKKKKKKAPDKNEYNVSDGKTDPTADIAEVKFRSRHEYDSAQQALPESARDGWLRRMMVRRNLEIKEKYRGNEDEFEREMIERFIHSIPYLLFISLPLYALFLKLLYIRQKGLYYTDHAIFLIYLYIFTFLFMLVFFGIKQLSAVMDWDWLDLVNGLLVLYGIYYAWRAMHKFYGQGRLRTTAKFILLNMLAFMSLLVLFLLFLALAFFRS